MIFDVLLVFAGMGLVGLLWKMLYDTSHFHTTEYIVRDPRIKKSVRAVVLSDLHNARYGRDNVLLLEAIEARKPDVVLIAGDMLTAKPKADPAPALDLLEKLGKKYPVYYGNGNHEQRLKLYPREYGELDRIYAEGLEKANIQPMINTRREIPETGIEVVGCEIAREYYKRIHKTPMEESYLKELLQSPGSNRYTILLAHNPDYFPEYGKWGADLVLAGHVHGGVVRIPFWDKGVISPALRLFPKYDGGLYREGDSTMLLSRGLGCHTIPVRLFNPGELIYLELTSGERLPVEKRTRKSKKNVVK